MGHRGLSPGSVYGCNGARTGKADRGPGADAVSVLARGAAGAGVKREGPGCGRSIGEQILSNFPIDGVGGARLGWIGRQHTQNTWVVSPCWSPNPASARWGDLLLPVQADDLRTLPPKRRPHPGDNQGANTPE